MSHVTMLSAVRLLIDRGLLSSRHGSGIYLPGVPRSRTVPSVKRPPSRPGWKQVFDRLEHDIEYGLWSDRIRPPSVKELCAAYHICTRTMHKSIRLAIARNLVRFERRRLIICRAEPATAASHVALIAAGTPMLNHDRIDVRHITVLQNIELACAQRSLGVRTVLYGYRGQQMIPLDRQHPLDPQHLDSTLGFTVVTRGLSPSFCTSLLAALTRSGRPVALLDENGAISVPGSANLRVFKFGYTQRCGEDMADYLIRLHHYRVAYVSLFHDQPWSRDRLSGLRERFTNAGLPDAVTAVTSPEDRTVAAMPPGVYPGDAFMDRLRTDTATLLTDRSITAWVTANDITGLACLQLLRTRRIDVPGELTVTAFDNTFAALLNGLTSYDFSARAAAEAMIRFLVSPQWNARRDTRENTVEIAGTVSERRTSAQAPAQRTQTRASQ